MNAICVLAAGCVLAQSGGALSESADGDSQPANIQIQSRWTTPVRAAYLEHDGPYWSVGPVFAQVRDYASQHGLTGEFFIRYLQDKPASMAGLKQILVGVLVGDDHRVQPPFERGEWPREWVASTSFKTGRISVVRVAGELHQWIVGKGYRASGTVTEIYGPRQEGSFAPGTVEVRMGILTSDAPTAKPPSSATTTRGEKQSHVIAAAEPQRSVSPRKSIPRLQRDPVREPVNDMRIAEPESRQESVAPSSDLAVAPADAAAAPSDSAAATNRSTDDLPVVGTTPEPETVAIKPVDLDSVEFAPIAELFERGDTVGVAEQLIPIPRDVPPAQQVWLGQCVFRLRALAKAFSKKSPSPDDRFRATVLAISDRYSIAERSFEHDVLSEAVVHTVDSDARSAARMRSAMLELDRLLAGVASGALRGDQVLVHFGSVLTLAQAVVWSRAPHED